MVFQKIHNRGLEFGGGRRDGSWTVCPKALSVCPTDSIEQGFSVARADGVRGHIASAQLSLCGHGPRRPILYQRSDWLITFFTYHLTSIVLRIGRKGGSTDPRERAPQRRRFAHSGPALQVATARATCQPSLARTHVRNPERCEPERLPDEYFALPQDPSEHLLGTGASSGAGDGSIRPLIGCLFH